MKNLALMLFAAFTITFMAPACISTQDTQPSISQHTSDVIGPGCVSESLFNVTYAAQTNPVNCPFPPPSLPSVVDISSGSLNHFWPNNGCFPGVPAADCANDIYGGYSGEPCNQEQDDELFTFAYNGTDQFSCMVTYSGDPNTLTGTCTLDHNVTTCDRHGRNCVTTSYTCTSSYTLTAQNPS